MRPRRRLPQPAVPLRGRVGEWGARRQRPPLAAARQLATHVERKVEARGEVLQVEAGGEALLQTSSPSLSPLRVTRRAERIASRKLVSVCSSSLPSSPVYRPPTPRRCPVRAWPFFTSRIYLSLVRSRLGRAASVRRLEFVRRPLARACGGGDGSRGRSACVRVRLRVCVNERQRAVP